MKVKLKEMKRKEREKKGKVKGKVRIKEIKSKTIGKSNFQSKKNCKCKVNVK